jgi:hypothetical protein
MTVLSFAAIHGFSDAGFNSKYRGHVKKFLVNLITMALICLALFRIAGAMLIHEDAQIVLNKDICAIVEGQIKNDVCIAKVDVSRDAFGKTLLQLKNGRVILLENPPSGMSYVKSHWEFFKNWI